MMEAAVDKVIQALKDAGPLANEAFNMLVAYNQTRWTLGAIAAAIVVVLALLGARWMVKKTSAVDAELRLADAAPFLAFCGFCGIVGLIAFTCFLARALNPIGATIASIVAP